MSAHWRLALLGAGVMAGLAAPAALAFWFWGGGAHAVAYLYGAAVGMLSFGSIAVTVALILGRTTPLKMLLGAMVYLGRLVFAAAAVGVPIFFGWWPVAPLVVGFAMVYVVENVVLLLGAAKMKGARGLSRA